MAFGAKKIFPIDTRPGTAVGVSIPFNSPSVFYSTYTTKDAIKNNLINFLLTDPGERYLNVGFGIGLKRFLFEQIEKNNLSYIEDIIQEQTKIYFPNLKITKLDILGNSDNNEIKISIEYNLLNTGITDQAQITFA